jgi:hypothetical protein
VADAYEQVATRIVAEIAPPVEMSGCTARILEKLEKALGPTA